MKKAIYAIAVTVLGFVLWCSYSFAQVDCDSAQEYCNKGINEIDANKQIQYYTKAIEFDESSECGSGEVGFAYMVRGLVYGKIGDFDKAIQDFNKAIELNPVFVDAFFARGIAYSGIGDFDKAIQDYNRAIGSNTEFVDAYYNRGNAYFNKGDYDSAIKDYNKAIELNPIVA